MLAQKERLCYNIIRVFGLKHEVSEENITEAMQAVWMMAKGGSDYEGSIICKTNL